MPVDLDIIDFPEPLEKVGEGLVSTVYAGPDTSGAWHAIKYFEEEDDTIVQNAIEQYEKLARIEELQKFLPRYYRKVYARMLGGEPRRTIAMPFLDAEAAPDIAATAKSIADFPTITIGEVGFGWREQDRGAAAVHKEVARPMPPHILTPDHFRLIVRDLTAIATIAGQHNIFLPFDTYSWSVPLTDPSIHARTWAMDFDNIDRHTRTKPENEDYDAMMSRVYADIDPADFTPDDMTAANLLILQNDVLYSIQKKQSVGIAHDDYETPNTIIAEEFTRVAKPYIDRNRERRNAALDAQCAAAEARLDALDASERA